MATIVFRGDSIAVAKEMRATPDTVEVGDIFTLTCGGDSVSFTATAGTVANVTAGLTAAWNASTYPQMAEITASDQTTYVKLLADTAGVDFLITSSTTDGGGNDTQTLVMSTAVANAGPNDATTVSNWSTGAVPTAADTVVFEDSDVDLLYNLDQIDFLILHVKMSYTGSIGFPEMNASGYAEYRATSLQGASCTTVNIGQGGGSGSSFTRLEFDGGTPNIVVTNTGTALDDTVKALMLTNFAAGTTVTVSKGSVAIDPYAGETSTATTVEIGYTTSDSDVDFYAGSGSTITTFEQSGGSAEVEAAVTTITQTGGSLYLNGTTLTTVTAYAGTLYYMTTTTIATLVIGSLATVNCERDMRAKTITNLSMYAGGAFLDPHGAVTVTNGIDLVGCSLEQCRISLGYNYTLTKSAI
jgi:hypothetical protein